MTASRRDQPAGDDEPKPNAGPPEKDPTNLKDLDQVDREIVRLKYTNRGLSNAQIGKLLVPPISKQAIQKRVTDHGLNFVLEQLGGDVVSSYKSHQATAVSVVAKTMTGHQTSWLAYQAATFFLQGVINSKLAEPDVPDIDDVVFTDANEPADKGRKK